MARAMAETLTPGPLGETRLDVRTQARRHLRRLTSTTGVCGGGSLMSARSIWRGALKLSLISIPVRLYPATTSRSDVSFRQFHRRCRTPLQVKKWCPHCDEEVTKEDIVKGHETSRGRVVFAEEGEIKKLRPGKSGSLAITDVMAASVVDPRFIERVYYLAPDSKEAGSAFDVVREALDTKAAVGRISMHGREYLTAIVADDDAMVLYTLRTAGEVLRRETAADLKFAGGRVKAQEVKLARQVLDSLQSDANLSEFTDTYQVRLREMLRRKGQGVATKDDPPEPGTKVVNLMDALRRSLESARPAARPPATRGGRTARVLKQSRSSRTRKAS
jgi:DNA end-binding protein Ku